MNAKILYAGDTSLSTAAAYLAGILTHEGLAFNYLASHEPIGPALAGAAYGLVILSDYPARNFQSADFAALLAAVRAGAGLVMIGGWESFHGLAGEYHRSPLAEALPVEMAASDDRVNSPQPCVVVKRCEHPILGDLPFDRPPTLGGYNRVTVKPGATEILEARHVGITAAGGQLTFEPGPAAPLLVVGQFGRGRTAAFTSDVAPHWVGTLVDWGDRRIKAQATGAGEVEVGSDYVALFARLVRWAMGEL